MRVRPIDEEVIAALLRFHARGERSVLVTLIHVDGSAPRPVGSQIAVSESGEAVGYITGGCAEAAFAAEAIDALRAGKARQRRYGAGSPYLDVKLPCGSGVDVHFAVDPRAAIISAIAERLSARKPAFLEIDLRSGELSLHGEAAARADRDGVFVRPYSPRIRLEIVGKGPVVRALARAGAATGYEINVVSPERETISAVADCADTVRRLSKPEEYAPAFVDARTAAAVLFHEHDWDPPVIAALLASPCFYIGALGSRKTHARRLDELRARGVCEEALETVNGPIGVDIHAKTPEEIAISILAEIIEAARSDGAGARWRR
ncbi:MAG: XdhC family protein [Parvularculaceae bacterium]|nr:XdhC family protein [Parvularculaceae bacterium]